MMLRSSGASRDTSVNRVSHQGAWYVSVINIIIINTIIIIIIFIIINYYY